MAEGVGWFAFANLPLGFAALRFMGLALRARQSNKFGPPDAGPAK